MRSFESCGEAPIGVVTNCVSMECATRGCAVAAASTAEPVSLDDLSLGKFARCPSCEHTAEFHQPEGCWYSVTNAKPGTTVGCNCAGWTLS